jgi:putative endonuclease
MFSAKQSILKNMKNNQIGKMGEEKACKFLIKNKYNLLERNYWQKFGEIDIIARAPDQTLVFIEVKTLLIKNRIWEERRSPEDNFTTHKYEKVKRMCEFFAARYEALIDDERGWRLDLVAIEFFDDGRFLIRHYENVP